MVQTTVISVVTAPSARVTSIATGNSGRSPAASSAMTSRTGRPSLATARTGPMASLRYAISDRTASAEREMLAERRHHHGAGCGLGEREDRARVRAGDVVVQPLLVRERGGGADVITVHPHIGDLDADSAGERDS
jgi:hypothetical protein